MTLHFWQIGFTDALTFMLFLSVRDPSAGQVVGRQFQPHLIARKDFNIVDAHLARDRRQDDFLPGDLHPEHGVRQGLEDVPFDFDLVFLAHALFVTSPPSGSRGRPASRRSYARSEPTTV